MVKCGEVAFYFQFHPESRVKVRSVFAAELDPFSIFCKNFDFAGHCRDGSAARCSRPSTVSRPVRKTLVLCIGGSYIRVVLVNTSRVYAGFKLRTMRSM